MKCLVNENFLFFFRLHQTVHPEGIVLPSKVKQNKSLYSVYCDGENVTICQLLDTSLGGMGIIIQYKGSCSHAGKRKGISFIVYDITMKYAQLWSDMAGYQNMYVWIWNSLRFKHNKKKNADLLNEYYSYRGCMYMDYLQICTDGWTVVVIPSYQLGISKRIYYLSLYKITDM